uniref:Cytochrome p450 n=1 Tax=Croton stellatopilosus TaxID=431156 RepID=A0A3G2CJY4_9ROSI|nr:cytochrome p450 [Croton stellatopilosus]
MENQLFFLILFTFSVFIIFLIKRKKPNKSTNLPPGPSNLPIIGGFHHLFGDLPHHCLANLSEKYGPIFHLQLGENSNVIISSAELAKEIMKTHDTNFASRPFVPSSFKATYDGTNIAFAPYGDYWRQLRKICTTELLSAARVRSFRSIREEEVNKLISSISSNYEGCPINLSRMMESLMFSIISRAVFGKVCRGEEVFVPTIRKLTEATTGFNLVDLYPSNKLLQRMSIGLPIIKKLHSEIDKIIQDEIDKHRARKESGKIVSESETQDLVDVLLDLLDKGDFDFPLSTQNIKAVILDMFIAGSDTSSTPIEWAMSEMMKNPKVMQKAQAEVRKVFGGKGEVDEVGLNELHYLKLVIKETLRLHPPVPLLVPRKCKEDCVIDGYDIPENTRVIVNAWAIGRNSKYWIEPEKFYPERFLDNSIDYKGADFEFIPFGAGRRMCPGISFGMANVELPLAHLLYYFNWKLESENLDMSESFSVTVKRSKPLYVIPTRYCASYYTM